MTEHDASTPQATPETQDDIAALRDALAERDRELDARAESSRVALERLRTALLASDPALDPVMVHGETVEAIEQSYAEAVALLRRVRDEVRREQAVPVPAGAPGRSATRFANAFEKIRHGLEG